MLFTEQRTCHVMNMPNMSKIKIKKIYKQFKWLQCYFSQYKMSLKLGEIKLNKKNSTDQSNQSISTKLK